MLRSARPTKSVEATIAMTVVIFTSGCTPTTEPYNVGEAVRQTMTAQIINPAPVYDTSIIITSGASAALALNRYRTDKVKRLQTTRTSNLPGGDTGSDS